MVSQKVTVTNPSGLHARPASMFVKEAKSHESKLTVKIGDNSVNGKSIIMILSSAICCGTEIELVLEGPDEQEALDALVELINSGMGE